MKEEKKIEFTQKWIRDAVKNYFKKRIFMKVIWRRSSICVLVRTSITAT